MRIFVVRHADAGSRSDWDEPDQLRPLSARGQRRAAELAEMLSGDGIERIISSPYLRCVQTVAPLARATSIPTELHGALAEGAWADDAVALVEELVADATTAVLCSHGDVIPELLAALARRGSAVEGSLGSAKGSIWVLDADPGSGSVRRATYAGGG